ncbi:MAG: HepT-like ribonuclease domain-containing protein [Actinomycetota bacterium]
MKDDRLHLEHMSEALERVRGYTSGGRKRFEGSPMAQDAVMRNLQTLAESTQRLSDDLRSRHPDVEWRAIAGFRNVLVHDYLGIDLDLVWNIIKERLPQLSATVNDELGP